MTKAPSTPQNRTWPSINAPLTISTENRSVRGPMNVLSAWMRARRLAISAAVGPPAWYSLLSSLAIAPSSAIDASVDRQAVMACCMCGAPEKYCNMKVMPGWAAGITLPRLKTSVISRLS